ncbi:hypothetical protein JVU11DRAFT_5629 [Chiua virens]|nr:hypothetical protein JVU11DRAFT_5629 [Chiua virens]
MPRLPPLRPSPWVFDANRNPPVYTRAMMGSELATQRTTVALGGVGDTCLGLNLVSSLNKEEMIDRTRRAVDKLRFVSPLIACTVEGDVQSYRWVYTPSGDRKAWLDLAFAVEDRGESINPSDFANAVVLKKLPYTDGKGTAIHFRVYLLTTSKARSDNTQEYGLYFHSAHCLMDAAPALCALNSMLEWMTGKGTDVTIVPSIEWKNLPVDPITATGGLAKEWETSLGTQFMEELERVQDDTRDYIGLTPPSRPLNMTDKPLHYVAALSESETAAIVAQTKKLGISVTALYQAANALAQLRLNPKRPGADLDLSLAVIPISLQRFLKPPANPKSHFVSALTALSLRFPVTQCLKEPTERGRLIAIAREVHERLGKLVAHPCLPQLGVAMASIPPSQKKNGGRMQNPWRCGVDSLGILEALVKTDHGAIKVDSMTAGNRKGPYTTMHVWTMHNKLTFDIQGASAWGEKTLKTLVEDTVKIGSLILEPPAKL